MSQLSVEEIYQAVGKIVEKFAVYQCYDCVRAVSKWLEYNNLEGKILKIKTNNRRKNYILSTRLERLGITESITDNGTHYGIEVFGKVFDNLSILGMTREEWLNDFHCPSEQFIVEELESI